MDDENASTALSTEGVRDENPNFEERKFDFDDEIIEELTHSDCWLLAAALRRHLNMSYAVIIGDGVMHHAAIELPNGNIVDIEGVWSSSDWTNFWYDELDDVWEVESGSPIEDDESYSLLYPEDDTFENTMYGALTLREIADQIVKDLLHVD